MLTQVVVDSADKDWAEMDPRCAYLGCARPPGCVPQIIAVRTAGLCS